MLKSAGRRIVIALICIGLVLVYGVATRTSVSYTATCAQCLQPERGNKLFILGIRTSHHKRPVAPLERRKSITRSGGGLPSVDPLTYEAINGKPCEHQFKRQGRGVGRYFFRLRSIGCGSYGEGQLFNHRFEMTESLFRAYSRIPDNALARRTITVMDELFPATASNEEAYRLSYDFKGSVMRFQSFVLLMGVLTTADEWEIALQWLEGGFNGTAPLIADKDFLEKRMLSGDPGVRIACSNVIWDTPEIATDAMLSQLLDDPDNLVSRRVRDTVFYSKRFSLFGKAFRKFPPDDFTIQEIGRYDDSEFTELFALDDTVVDDACFKAIADTQQLRFLDVLVARMNHRESETCRTAIEQLIRGPSPISFGGIDKWESTEAEVKPLGELLRRVKEGTDFPTGDRRQWEFLPTVKAIAAKGGAEHWHMLRDAFLKEISGRTDPAWTAVVAKSMYLLDPIRTESFLIAEISGEETDRVCAAFAGMGLIASPAFTDAIVAFKTNPPTYSKDNHTPPSTNMGGNNAQYYDYALHRCRRIQDWRLEKDGDGEYSIKKS